MTTMRKPIIPAAKGATETIGMMMWHEQHCIHRQDDGKCKLDGDECPWRHPVKTLAQLHDWYPCFTAEGRVSYPEGCE